MMDASETRPKRERIFVSDNVKDRDEWNPMSQETGEQFSAIRVARLCDNPAEGPFRFRLGDRVGWRHHDGAADEEVRGTITDGTCIYAVNGGFRQLPIYIVTCDNGQKITAAEMTLVLVRSVTSKGPRY